MVSSVAEAVLSGLSASLGWLLQGMFMGVFLVFRERAAAFHSLRAARARRRSMENIETILKAKKEEF